MIGWPLIILCWVVSFVFAGIEAGLLSLDQIRLRHQVKLRNRAAIKLDPGFAIAHYNLGSALAQTGHMDDAERELALALHYNPDYRDAREMLDRLTKQSKKP